MGASWGEVAQEVRLGFQRRWKNDGLRYHGGSHIEMDGEKSGKSYQRMDHGKWGFPRMGVPQ